MSKLDKNYEFNSKEFSEYLNSYYQQFGIPHDKDERGAISRPTTEQIFQNFNTITQRVEYFIRSESHHDNAIKLITMGFHHECQHQELLVYDLQHLLAEQYRPEDEAVQMLAKSGFRPDYVSIRRQSDLGVPLPDDRKLVVLVAAWLGQTRLIDNLEVALNRAS